MQAASVVTAPIPESVKAYSISAHRVHGTLIRRKYGLNLVAARETCSLKFSEMKVLTIPRNHIMTKGVLCVRFGSTGPFECQGLS